MSKDIDTKAIHGLIEGGYFIIPNRLITLGIWASMSGSEKAVYIALNRYADNDTGHGYPSIATISKFAGVARGTASLAIQGLEVRGLIRVKRGRNPDNNLSHVNEYWITRPDSWGGSAKIGLVRKSGGGSAKIGPELDSVELDSDSSAGKPRRAKSSKKKTKPRKRDRLFEAVAHIMTGDPYSSEWNVTHKLMAGRINRVVKHLRELGIAPGEIDAVREAYESERLSSGLPYLSSPNTIAAHVDRLRNKPTQKPVQHVAMHHIAPPTDEDIF